MGRKTLAGSALLLFGDDRLDAGGRSASQLNLDHVGAGLVDRLLEADLAAVDLQTAGITNRVRDLLRRDRAEELAVLAGAVVDGEDGLRHQRRGFLGALGCLALAALLGLQPSLRLLQCSLGGGLGELARQQIVAEVSGRNLHRLSPAAEVLDVLQEDRLRHQRSPT
jgi:hypothetical protein